jgi:hypothetical protein
MTASEQFARLGDAGAWYQQQLDEGNWHAIVQTFLGALDHTPHAMALGYTNDATAWWMLDSLLLALRERIDTAERERDAALRLLEDYETAVDRPGDPSGGTIICLRCRSTWPTDGVPMHTPGCLFCARSKP